MLVERSSFRITLSDRFIAISMSHVKYAIGDHYFVISESGRRDLCREPKYLVLEYLDYIRR